jgi:probable FeS assembly SUF system protein SufT
MSAHLHEPVILTREVPSTQIPSGMLMMLAEGTEVIVTQKLGGNFTVSTPSGYLARIDAKDADALGLEFVAEVEAQKAAEAATPGEFKEARVWDELRTVYDPEIPVNIVDLGLIYGCTCTPSPEGQRIDVKMSMTAPGCGMGDILKEDVRRKILALPGVADATVEVVWEPPWDQSRMTEAAKLQLGWL